MSLTLGEKLRQAREERGISISEVAEQTRISALYLESIENNDYRSLPGGIFNKGFVKSYAKFVGIDDQEALQDYSRLMAEQGTDVSTQETKTYRPEVLTDDQARSTSLPTLIFAVIILGLLAGGVYYFVNYWQNSQNQPIANNSANANKTANSANTNANVNAAPTPIPAVSEIKLEFKPLGNPISVSHTVDGKTVNKTVTSAEPLSLTAQQSIRISYYKGFTPDKVQMTLNGKQIAAPAPPAKGNIIFEINKDNAAQILQAGAVTSAAPSAPAAR